MDTNIHALIALEKLARSITRKMAYTASLDCHRKRWASIPHKTCLVQRSCIFVLCVIIKIIYTRVKAVIGILSLSFIRKV